MNKVARVCLEDKARYTKEEISELHELLSMLPERHLEALSIIRRSSKINCVAMASGHGVGGDLVLGKSFFELSNRERKFILYHEMGHNYFDYMDDNLGRYTLGHKLFSIDEARVILRVQWMELGSWELDELKWQEIKPWFKDYKVPINDKYDYIVRLNDPNNRMGEWIHPIFGRLKSPKYTYAFRYSWEGYSPKEEQADAYALFLLHPDKFQEAARKNPVIQKKFEFMQFQFKDEKRTELEFVSSLDKL